jgi:FtsZ-binding cell division protein ZapB
MKKILLVFTITLLTFGLIGCSQKSSNTQEAYDALKGQNEELESKNTELQRQVDELTAENESLKAEPTVAPTPIPTSIPEVKNLSGSDLEAKLAEQPVYVISTDYLIQSDEYKSLYPDMLNAVIKNNSGTEVKNVVISFAAWDENYLPVKINGQYDFDGGKYINECDLGDVNMVDGSTFGEDMGMSLSEDCDNIKIVKAIVREYTDFDEKKWKNPYYDAWTSAYENKKLEK